MNCLHCQITIELNERFCGGCGVPVSTTPQAATTVTDLANEATVGKEDRLLGSILDAKYELLARLGAGGMGTVYRARRVHIGDEVAVKVLHQNYCPEADMMERFRREARTCATLRHPNVVALYDYSETRTDALAYIVMELVPGATLGQLLKGGNRLSLPRALTLMGHICAGVGAAHHRQIVHRDLKPDNIIVVPPNRDSASETAKVVDFGIAKLRDLAATQALTEAGMIIGTPFYMSPEQCRSDELDARSDVYSLGVMFYEMIAGMRPFTAPTPTGVIAKHLTQAPPPLHATLRVPRAVEAVLMRALAKDAAARQADALVLARELESAWQQTSIAPPVKAPAPQPHGVRNALLVLAALFCLMIGGVGWLAFHFVSAWQTAQQGASSPMPNRASAKPTPTATPKMALIVATPRPTPPRVTASSLPTPPPLGIVKTHEPPRVATKAALPTVPVRKSLPAAQRVQRIPTNDDDGQLPPEVRRVMQQLLQSGIPTRDAAGKVKTIYVTRPVN